MSFFTKNIVRLFNSVVLICIVVGLGIFTLIIGYYNYQTSMNELRNKAANTGDLAAISLKEPLWNYDETAMQDIFAAILLDKDVVAIRVLKNNDTKPIAEKLRDDSNNANFEDLLNNPVNVDTQSAIVRDGNPFAKVQIITSSEKVQALIRYTTLLISAFAMVFVIILSSFIWYLGVRIIKKPIDALRGSADNLARGNLNETINTSRKDELGSLAVSFDQMRNAIRKKLSDLAVLNQTGEQLSSTYKQQDVFDLSTRVMIEKLNADEGQVLLLNDSKTLVLHASLAPNNQQVSSELKKTAERLANEAVSSAKVTFINTNNKSVLSIPMMDGPKVYGVMQFAGSQEHFSFTPEDEGFALTIARMSVNTIKNIQMVSVIEEQNRTLEEKILQRTAELRQKTNDVNSMLQNMRQGIFTIVRGGMIHPEYSNYLTEIFETKNIANTDVFPFLFHRSDVGGDLLNQLEATVDSMIGEDSMNFEFNAHLLVHEYTKYFDDDKTKILELDWNPVLNANGNIEKLMVTARDVTELKALQRETEKQKAELDIIGQILSISKDKLLEFIQTSNAFLDENENLIQSTASMDSQVLATLFRNMHTIKGNARTYGFSYITDAVHMAESTYTDLLNAPESNWEPNVLIEQLNGARECIKRYESVFKGKLEGFTESAAPTVDFSLLQNIAQAVDGINELSAVSALKKSLSLVRDTINAANSEALPEVLRGIVDGVPSIAKQLNKEAPHVVIHDHAVRIKRDVAPMMRNVFMHIFRNSMDHGLEATSERIAVGKAVQGSIQLEAIRGDEEVTFVFNDDGKGLALNAIRDKAIANGKISADQALTDEEIAELIFVPGLSTAAEITQVSGRGVGMDAVRKFLNKYEGDVKLIFTGETNSAGFRPFKMHITLPSNFAV